uniref:Interferon regulatory factor 3 n=1 Tax=Podarcis muralis TaxID=64176 RepID=A0A670IUV6_PODMU
SWDRATRAQPLIVPWLMEQLDARRYPGLSWLNPERTLFRVPWKHGSRQNILGRHRPGIDQRTPSEWKRNFRSALNRKEGIRMFQDNSTDSEDPHKVFEILPCSHGMGKWKEEAEQPVGETPVGGGQGKRNKQSVNLLYPVLQGDTLESMLSSLEYCSPTEGE